MRISWKNFFLSFGAAFVLFSLLMAFVCADLFGGFVPSPDVESPQELTGEARGDYESYIFYCYDKTGEVLEFAALVRVDAKKERILTTHLEGDDLLERQGSLFYIRSLCEDRGRGELAPIFEALTGYEVESGRILNARDYLPSSVKDGTVRYLDFVEALPMTWDGAGEHFSVSECALAAQENGDVRILDVKASLEAFRTLK